MEDNNEINDKVSKKSSKKSMKLGVLTSMNTNEKIEDKENDIVNTASKENVNKQANEILLSDRRLISDNSNQTISKLVYRIIHCSSEINSNPSYELLKGAQSNSWISERFCVFPQELFLKFISPINVSQINILSHESKISSRIDIFYFNPSNNFEIFDLKDLTRVKFQYIGFIKFDDNERTYFKARELKKIQVNVNCLYLKFQLHSNHINKLNIFNQISIFSIDCYGRSIRPENNLSEIKNDIPTSNNNIDINSNLNKNTLILSSNISNFDDKFDDMSKEKLKYYKEKIQEALKIEDYDEASKLKIYVDKIRTIGKKLLDIESQKREFIMNEDFNSCKFLKVESDRLKLILNNIEQQPISVENQYYNTLNNQKEINYDNKFNDEIVNNNEKFITNRENENLTSNTGFRKSFSNEQKFNKSTESYNSIKELNINYNANTNNSNVNLKEKIVKYDETVSIFYFR